MHIACWRIKTVVVVVREEERGQRRYMLYTQKKKKATWGRESYNKRCTYGTILHHFHQVVSSSSLRNFPFAHMHKWVCVYVHEHPDPHSLQIPSLQIFLLLKFICDPKIRVRWALMVICGHEKSDPKSVSWCCIPNWYQRRQFFAFLF